MRRISSRSNPLVGRFRNAARGRDADDSVLLDGEHLIDEALTSGVTLETVAMSDAVGDSRSPLVDRILDRLAAAGTEVVRVPDQVMSAMSPVQQPSGIVALGHARSSTLDQVLAASPQLLVVMNAIQDAGNVGAIVRAADGCGATGIVATDGTADPFGWKALRGAMGSTFHIPIAVRQSATAVVAMLRERNVRIVATVPRTGTPLPGFPLREPVAIFLGAEGAGLSVDIVESADDRLSIPMREPVESFNVAITAALILYEAAQQRNGHVPLPRSRA